MKVRIRSFIRVAAELRLRPFEPERWAVPPQTDGLFLALFSPAIAALFPSVLHPFFPLCDTLLLYCNSAGSGLNPQQ